MKMKKLYIPFILLLIFCTSLWAQNKYYKGNTHTHCFPYSGDVKDSSYTGETVIKQYKEKGYDFLIFTDHGAWWDAAKYSSPEFIVINGEEPGISGNGRGGHFSAFNLKSKVNGKNKTYQELINDIYNQNAIPVLNHPRWDRIPISAKKVMDSMKENLMHIEIYNAGSYKPDGLSDVTVWDSVLSSGRLIYGIASDDSHREVKQGKAWIMVRSSSLCMDSLIKAIKVGDYYCSTGIYLDDISCTRKMISIKSKNGTEIKFIGKDGKVFSAVKKKSANYKIKGNEGYIRTEIINKNGEKAWTQPYMIY
jgi:hypothetical protein